MKIKVIDKTHFYIPSETDCIDSSYIDISTEDLISLSKKEKCFDGDCKTLIPFALTLEEVNAARRAELIMQREKLMSDVRDNDYKVRKCYEYQLVGESLPYDISAIHEQDQAKRNEINRIEEELLDLDASNI